MNSNKSGVSGGNGRLCSKFYFILLNSGIGVSGCITKQLLVFKNPWKATVKKKNVILNFSLLAYCYLLGMVNGQKIKSI